MRSPRADDPGDLGPCPNFNGLYDALNAWNDTSTTSPATTSAKLVLVPVFALTVCSWGALCAFLVTSSITARLRPLGDAILAITEAGSVRDARRLPVERADELGHIIRATNDMVARLAEAETSRDRAVADLESLARSLETQVTDRTQEIRLVMQTIAEMYFCVDKDGVVVGTHSLETERRFDREGERVAGRRGRVMRQENPPTPRRSYPGVCCHGLSQPVKVCRHSREDLDLISKPICRPN